MWSEPACGGGLINKCQWWTSFLGAAARHSHGHRPILPQETQCQRYQVGGWVAGWVCCKINENLGTLRACRGRLGAGAQMSPARNIKCLDSAGPHVCQSLPACLPGAAAAAAVAAGREKGPSPRCKIIGWLWLGMEGQKHLMTQPYCSYHIWTIRWFTCAGLRLLAEAPESGQYTKYTSR